MNGPNDYLSDPVWQALYAPVDRFFKEIDKELPLNSVINSALDVVAPVDPSSGTRPSLLDQLTSSSLTAAERSDIVKTLVKLPVSERYAVSDKTLASMLPSRYNITQSDYQGVRDFYASQIFSDPAFKDAVVDEAAKK